MVLKSTFDLGVPRGTRTARITSIFAFWNLTRTSGATTDLLLVSAAVMLGTRDLRGHGSLIEDGWLR